MGHLLDLHLLESLDLRQNPVQVRGGGVGRLWGVDVCGVVHVMYLILYVGGKVEEQRGGNRNVLKCEQRCLLVLCH